MRGIIQHANLWGIYLGVAVWLSTQILTWLGMGLINWFVILTCLPVILFAWFGFTNYLNTNDQKVGYLQGIFWTLIVIIMGHSVFQCYMFLYACYISQDRADNVVVMWADHLSTTSLSEEEFTKGIEGVRKPCEAIPIFTIEIVTYGLSQFVPAMMIIFFKVCKSRRVP